MLTVVLPGLRMPTPAGFHPSDGLDLPALSFLLGRAHRTLVPQAGGEAWLAAQFGLSEGGAAALSRRIDLPDADGGTWLRADPVHLRVDRDRALLFDASLLSIEQHEASQLVDALNRQFADDGLRFHAPAPSRWYVNVEKPPAITTSPLHRATGQDVRQHMPRGADALRWHGILNEIQMLMYTQPVNDAREQSGRLLINSVWLWGEGALPTVQRKPWPIVWADDVALQATASLAGAQHGTLPAAFDAPQADSLVWLDTLAPAARLGDLESWRAGLQTLERNWFAPMLAAWRQGRAPALTLILPGEGDTHAFSVTGSDRWRFWRRPTSIPHYLHQEG